MKKLLLVTLLGLSINIANASSSVMCHFDSFSMPHNDRQHPVTSSHQVTIINEEMKDKDYVFTYQTFINKEVIKTETYTYHVKGMGRLDDGRTMYTFLVFDKKRYYDASCRTTISTMSGGERNQINGGGHIRIT